MSTIIRNCDSGLADVFSDSRSYAHMFELWRTYSFSFIVVRTLLSSMDSDLEAFSHNPTDGSFTALAFQLTVFTNYLIQGFLSY